MTVKIEPYWTHLCNAYHAKKCTECGANMLLCQQGGQVLFSCGRDKCGAEALVSLDDIAEIISMATREGYTKGDCDGYNRGYRAERVSGWG